MLGQAWDLLDRVRQGWGALWLGQSPSQWNHSSMPRVQGWECHILVLNHLALFGAPLLALFCFLQLEALNDYFVCLISTYEY